MIYLSHSSCILSAFTQVTPADFGYWEQLRYKLVHSLFYDAISPIDTKQIMSDKKGVSLNLWIWKEMIVTSFRVEYWSDNSLRVLR
jgi:hypothetical protein